MSKLRSKQIFLTGSFSGSFSGDGSGLFNVTASNVVGLDLSRIATGSVTASVSTGYDGIFLIKSGSFSFLEISGSSNVVLNSNFFVVKNFSTKEPVLTVSQSIVQVATQSFDPTGTTQAGSIWFTSSSFYVGLE